MENEVVSVSGGFVCVCVCTNLEGSSFHRVENQESLEEVLTVSGHVEGDPVFTPQNPLT